MCVCVCVCACVRVRVCVIERESVHVCIHKRYYYGYYNVPGLLSTVLIHWSQYHCRVVTRACTICIM